MKPVEIEFLIKNGTRGTLEKITADLLQVGSTASSSGSSAGVSLEKAHLQAMLLKDVIANLESQLHQLQAASPSLSQADNISEINQLESHIENLKVHLKQMEEIAEDTQVVPPSMAGAQKKFDGLHFSIQQIAREMPSLAMGPQMFFLAISNNLPILSDEIARAKREYSELLKTGQKGTPVWKQILKSLFSWQTAMTTGIMLLVMYGGELVKSISDMTGWGAAARKNREEAEELAEAEKKMMEQTSSAATEVETLSRMWSQLGDNMSEKTAFLKDNAEAFNRLGISVKSVADAENLLVRNKQAFIEAQFAKAEAGVLSEIAAEKYRELLEAQKELEQVPKAYVERKGTYTDGYGNKREGIVMEKSSSWQDAVDGVSAAEKAYNNIMDKVVNKQGKAAEILRNANLDLNNEIKEGTIAWYEEQITLKKNHLKTLSVTDKDEIDAINKQIKAYQQVIDNANGKENDTDNTHDKYQEDYIASIRKAQAEELALRKAQTEDKIKLIELERDARIQAINDEKAAYAKKYGKDADTSGFDRQIQATNEQAQLDTDNLRKENVRADLEQQETYLKEYGTFQQKKYAMAQEYARKIQEAQTAGEKKILEGELASFNSVIETEILKLNIDWGTVFGGFGGMFSDMVSPALEEVKRYMQTDSFKNSDASSQQALIEAMNQMEQSMGKSGGLNFKKLGDDMQIYQDSLLAVNEAKIKEAEALNLLAEAQKKYNEALENGTQSEIDSAFIALESAQDTSDAASEIVNTTTVAANTAMNNVSNTASSLNASMANVTQGLSKIASGSLTGAYEGLIQFSKGAGGVMEKFANKLEDIPIIGWIVSIIDLFKDGISIVIEGLLDAIFNAVSGIIGDILSGDIFVTIAESLSKGIFNVVKSIITMGGIFDFLDAESDPTLQADIDKLTASNERLEEALNQLSDKMEKASMSDAKGVHEEQLENLRQREQNKQEQMQREGAAWARFGYGFAGLGGKHSSNHFIDEGVSGDEWGEISKIVGRKISSAADFWGLSPEEMAKVAEEAGWIYDKIKGYADDGHKDASKYMDEYIAYAKEREELEKALYEKLTNTTFDSVRDEFKNTLLDMSSDASTFSDNFRNMMRNAIVESLMVEKYDKLLKEWYKAFGDAMASNGELTDEEKEELKEEYDKIVNDALEEREKLKDVLGGTSVEQQGKAGAFGAMDMEKANKLEGLFTTNEIHVARMDENLESVAEQMNTAMFYLSRIEENTSYCKYLPAIKNELSKLIRDGVKVR